MSNSTKEAIAAFIYRFNTFDPDDIKTAIPEAANLSPDELASIVAEDHSRASREIEYDINAIVLE